VVSSPPSCTSRINHLRDGGPDNRSPIGFLVTQLVTFGSPLRDLTAVRSASHRLGRGAPSDDRARFRPASAERL
jgi:hypothetical protein